MSQTNNILEVGLQVGKLTLVRQTRVAQRSGVFWVCRCVCGRETTKYAGHLRNASAKTCGCIKGAKRTHCMSRTPEYKAWDNARSRCYRPKDRKYPSYGGRGITVCDRWRTSFATFFADMGRKPSPSHTLDRIDSDGPYSPENCRWATYGEQNNNRSFNRWLTVNGQRVTIAQASRLTGIPHGTILSRLDRGLSDQEAVNG